MESTQSMSFKQNAIPLVEQYFTPKLAQIKMLSLGIDDQNPQAGINFAQNWLTLDDDDERRDHTEPRLLEVYQESNTLRQISMDVQQVYSLLTKLKLFCF